MDMSPEVDQIALAMVKVQAALKPAVIDSDNPFYHSRFASINAVWDACRELLTDNGLSVVQTTDEAALPGHVIIVTTLLHRSGQWIRGRLSLPTQRVDKQGNLKPPDPQSCGSAITYGRRYGLAAIVGICADEDDDGEGQMGRGKAPAKGKASAKKPAASKPKPEPKRSAEGLLCPDCAGPMWDNRPDRAKDKADIEAGTRTKKARPAWKCKDKACDGFWWDSDPDGEKGAASKPEATQDDSLLGQAKRILAQSMIACGINLDDMPVKVRDLCRNEMGCERLEDAHDDHLKNIIEFADDPVNWETCKWTAPF